MRARLALVLAVSALALTAPQASAAAPLITESWVTDVTATGARLRTEINPNGPFTSYRFEYVSEAEFQKSGFANALKAPPSGTAPLGAGGSSISVSQSVGNLAPATTYRYRAIAINADGTTIGPERLFSTQESVLDLGLPDDRAWEMVSPIDKGGGSVANPGSLFGGGHLQAASSGGAITYGSASAFANPKGAPPASQYVSRRTSSGWLTENVSAPLDSGAYGDNPDGAPYRLFSSDLSQGLLFGGLPCRGGLAGCPAPNPVLPGTGAPQGFMAYYLRDGGTGAFSSLLSAADVAHTAVEPEHFEVSFAAATPSLSHVVLESCAALTANATEVPAGPECDPQEQNLYLRSSVGLELINLLPGESEGTPGAEIAAPLGAISEDASRTYWTQGGNLYLREGNQSFQVDEAIGGGGTFEATSTDGSVAFLSKGGHLHRFIANTKAIADLTPSGGLVGVLGASSDGSRVYFQDAAGLKLWDAGSTTTIAPGANAAVSSNFPPSTGTARVSPGGEHLAFLSTQELVPYDNDGMREAYLYGPPVGGGAPQLICASCNPTGERPQGEASIPGAIENGSTTAHKPRALSANGARLFFDTSDAFAGDTNNRPDVYQWEAQGEGSCDRSPGCLKLISSGRALQGATFIDASQDGAEAYFTTDESLVPSDPGSIDLYAAKVGGGFPVPDKPIVCVADACQSLPAAPDDPTPGTLTPNAGNPAARIVREKTNRCASKKGKAKRRCLRKGKRGGKGKGRGRGGRR